MLLFGTSVAVCHVLGESLHPGLHRIVTITCVRAISDGVLSIYFTYNTMEGSQSGACT